MAKTWDYRGNGRKGSFGQKKKKLEEGKISNYLIYNFLNFLRK